jgi:uncharacterized protein (DUF2132 family)
VKKIKNMTVQKNNPLHGKTLQAILEELVVRYRWEGLAYHIDINCFKSNPSIKSSLIFLRKTPWARKKVEDLYLEAFTSNQ